MKLNKKTFTLISLIGTISLLNFNTPALAKPASANSEVSNQEFNLRPLQNRVGTENKPEVTASPIPKMASIDKSNSKFNKDNIKEVSNFDLDNKKIADEIYQELNEEQDLMVQDLRILWQAAAGNSETIKFAIYKLSNPNGEKVDQSMVKKILNPIANIAPLFGSSSSNPFAASGSILGGGLLSSVLSDDKALNKQLSQVNDADLIILAKEIDDLQQKLVVLYYNYITTLKVLNYSDTVVQNRYKYYTAVSTKNSSNLSIADAFYRESLDNQYKARQDLMNARGALEQFVGNDAISEIEKSIKSRISSN